MLTHLSVWMFWNVRPSWLHGLPVASHYYDDPRLYALCLLCSLNYVHSTLLAYFLPLVLHPLLRLFSGHVRYVLAVICLQ